MKLEENTLVPRGLDYVEGIAKVFESRNYLVNAGGRAGDFRSILFLLNGLMKKKIYMLF